MNPRNLFALLSNRRQPTYAEALARQAKATKVLIPLRLREASVLRFPSVLSLPSVTSVPATP